MIRPLSLGTSHRQDVLWRGEKGGGGRGAPLNITTCSHNLIASRSNRDDMMMMLTSSRLIRDMSNLGFHMLTIATWQARHERSIAETLLPQKALIKGKEGKRRKRGEVQDTIIRIDLGSCDSTNVHRLPGYFKPGKRIGMRSRIDLQLTWCAGLHTDRITLDGMLRFLIGCYVRHNSLASSWLLRAH